MDKVNNKRILASYSDVEVKGKRGNHKVFITSEAIYVFAHGRIANVTKGISGFVIIIMLLVLWKNRYSMTWQQGVPIFVIFFLIIGLYFLGCYIDTRRFKACVNSSAPIKFPNLIYPIATFREAKARGVADGTYNLVVGDTEFEFDNTGDVRRLREILRTLFKDDRFGDEWD